MISVYFKTTLDGYYEDELGLSITVSIFSFTGKIVSSEVLLMHKAIT